MKLHNEGKSNKQIVEILKSIGIKRRNKMDFIQLKMIGFV